MIKKDKDIHLFCSIMEWIKQHRKKPNMKSENPVERLYANRLKDLRRSLKGKETKTPFHKEYFEITESYGFRYFFDKDTIKER
jgi:hypothetical protein